MRRIVIIGMLVAIALLLIAQFAPSLLGGSVR